MEKLCNDILLPIRKVDIMIEERVQDLRIPFRLAYRNGEILCLLLGNLGTDIETIKERVKMNEDACKKPSSSSIVLYDVINTSLSDEVVKEIVESLIRLKDSIRRIAFIGGTWTERRKLKRNITMQSELKHIQFKYLTDMEPGKEWLIPMN